MVINKQFYTVEEIAKLLDVNYRTILREIERKMLTAHRVGRTFIIDKVALKDYFSSKNIKKTINVAVAIIEDRGKILLVKRKKSEGQLCWQFPAGTVLVNEHPARRAELEAVDETNVKCQAVKLLGERIHPDTRVIISYWLCKYISGTVKNADPTENTKVEWVKKSQVLRHFTSNTFPPVKKFLSKYNNFGRKLTRIA